MRQRWRLGVVVVLIALVLLGNLTSLKPTSGDHVNGTELERQIASALAERGHATTVSCPDDRPSKPGATFTCIATTADGDELKVRVVQEAHGNVSWDIPGAVLDTSKLIASAKPQLPASAVITCPRRTLHLEHAGDTASCSVRDGASLTHLVIRLADATTGRVTAILAPSAD